MIPGPPISTLFPYTTLFRSHKVDGMNAVCEQQEWDEMERARPGYHRLIRSGITNEAEAEKLARGTSGDPIKPRDRKSTRLNSSHRCISYAVFCLKKKKKHKN